MYDMLIIGSGPAGMGAAIYGVRAGLSLAVLDRSPISGGQVLTTYEVDNYLGLPQISGGEISQKFREHADSLGVNFVTANVTSIEDKKDCKLFIQKKVTMRRRHFFWQPVQLMPCLA